MTSTVSPPSMRRRMKILDHAQSIADVAARHRKCPPSSSSPSLGDAHSHTDDSPSDDDDQHASETTSQSSPGTSTPRPDHAYTATQPLSTPPASRAWYEFDLPVLAALVSPIGNWLTGGDHVKNLLLIVLLVFYLHQIIEIPWSLYQSSRPRSPTPNKISDANASQKCSSAEARLHTLELFYLALTALSPFLGAMLLRYATAAILGDDSISWFSTSLFVLTTAIRPWAHLVDRLNGQTQALHTLVACDPVATQYRASIAASDQRAKEARARAAKDRKEMNQRFIDLDRAVRALKRDADGAKEEVYAYVDDALGRLQHGALTRLDKRTHKAEDSAVSVERRIRALESRIRDHPRRGAMVGTSVVQVSIGVVQGGVAMMLACVNALQTVQLQLSPRRLAFVLHPRRLVRSLLERILPAWIFNPRSDNLYRDAYFTHSAYSTPHASSPIHTSYSTRAMHSSPSPKYIPRPLSAINLATIAEEDAAVGTGMDASLGAKDEGKDSDGAAREYGYFKIYKDDRNGAMCERGSLSLASRIGYTLTLPLRAALRMAFSLMDDSCVSS